MAGWILAIDFGTTNTTGVIGDGDRAELVEIGGSTRMPSVVLATDSGGLVVGAAAEQQMGLAPERAERTPKRRLGDDVMLLGGRAVPPVEAVGAILGAIAEEAIRRQGGEPPTELRLTHPARWGSVRLRALAEAAQIAELPVPSFVSEPVAAAVYFADERVADGDHVAVYDLGGGTFDTAVLRRSSAGFDVVGLPGGDERLGGETFDERLFTFMGSRLAEISPEAWEELRFSSERQWRKAGFDFRLEIRRAKEALSANADYTMYLGAPVDAELVITRDEFEGLIRPDIESTLTEFEATVRRAGLEVSDISAVNLVGGSSRIPLVTRMVAERFGRVPDTWGDPKAVVALGAVKATQLSSVPSASTLSATGSGATRATAALPDEIGGHEILAELGRGGMGVVYLARQASLGRLVAVKTLPTLDDGLTARLEREAAILAELQHPHIATVLDVGSDGRATYVVMPFFPGGTVAHTLDRHGALTSAQAVGVLASVAEALAATHAQGFLHRDVKPSNILLSADGEPYLADFGLAFPLLDASRMTNSRAVLGTAPYTSPEIIADEQATPASDTYSLGITGYQLLSGRLPYAGTNVLAVLDAIHRGTAEPLSEVGDGVDPEVARLVTQAFAADPAQRPDDLRAWAAELRAAAPPTPVPVAPPPAWAGAVLAAGGDGGPESPVGVVALAANHEEPTDPPPPPPPPATSPPPPPPPAIHSGAEATTVVAAGAAMAESPDLAGAHTGTPSKTRRRALVAAGVGVAVLLLAGVAVAASGGGSSKIRTIGTTQVTQTKTKVTTSITTAPTTPATPAPTVTAPVATAAPATAPPATTPVIHTVPTVHQTQPQVANTPPTPNPKYAGWVGSFTTEQECSGAACSYYGFTFLGDEFIDAQGDAWQLASATLTSGDGYLTVDRTSAGCGRGCVDFHPNSPYALPMSFAITWYVTDPSGSNQMSGPLLLRYQINSG